MRTISTIAVVAGIGLVAVSWIWPILAGGRQHWTDEQAESYSEVSASLHSLTYKAAQDQELAKRLGEAKNPQAALADQQLAKAAETGAAVNPATASADRLQAELAAARERYQRERAELDNARSHGHGAALILRWLGAGLFVAGLIGTFVLHLQDGR